MPDDLFVQYYGAKLWSLVPAVYRARDSEPVEPGPLREMVDRIAAQAAIVRRSVDRLWEDQSIESCDDWIIPYIGDLLATNLVAALDARGQRLDVAKTIYYRRRKGTVGLLEELASDIADRDARVVEFFRRLGRTRHNFDPPIGPVPFFGGASEPVPPAVIEGLAGAYTRTPMGGYADLRQAYGAAKAHTAFDEYAHTADFRRGRTSVGWHNIPKLGVFVWWLKTYLVGDTTPVLHPSCAGQFTFDPTGREIPLFARTQRSAERFGEHWISPDEWQLPVPIGQDLFDLQPDQLYPSSLAVLEGDTPPFSPMTLDRVVVDTERGRFRLQGAPPAGDTVHVRYTYGFGSEIGAGPYDQRLRRARLPEQPPPVRLAAGGGNALSTATTALPAQATVSVRDSLTYGAPVDVSGVDHLVIAGKNRERPVVRWTATPRPVWTVTGNPGSTLALQGLHLAGADIVLAGDFDSVLLRCCTLDPGTSGDRAQPPALFASAIDGVLLAPTRLYIEATVRTFRVERSITGPLRARTPGSIEHLQISDSILQALPESMGGLFVSSDLYDAGALAADLQNSSDPLSTFLRGRLSAAGVAAVDAYDPAAVAPPALADRLRQDLNAIIDGGASIYEAARFAGVRLSAKTRALAGQTLTGAALTDLNRRLLEEAYPAALGAPAIATTAGDVELVRTTVLGRIAVHRLHASECVLGDLAVADDDQHGCIRFSAYAEGSVIHQPYESVAILPEAPVFRTRRFGEPQYARLREGADDLIVAGGPDGTMLAGAEDGSEMGAFGLERIPVKKRGLRQKFAEYMPIGLVPVWIDVT